MNPSIAFELTAPSLADLPAADRPEIALAGRSNVGKSSFINSLSGRRNPARTSSTPGKTQALNVYRLDGVRLVDLPGYGFARAPRKAKAAWQRLTDDYLNGRDALAAVVLLVDVRHPAFTTDRNMLDWILSQGLPYLVLATKADKLKRGALATSLAQLTRDLSLGGHSAEPGIVPFSSVSGQGRREALAFLERFEP